MGYALKETEYRYRAWTKNGTWEKGSLTTDKYITIHEGSNVFHYGQALFEGLKAYRTKDNKIQLFRPDLNIIRLNDGLDRIVAPRIPEELFYEAVEEVVNLENRWYIIDNDLTLQRVRYLSRFRTKSPTFALNKYNGPYKEELLRAIPRPARD